MLSFCLVAVLLIGPCSLSALAAPLPATNNELKASSKGPQELIFPTTYKIIKRGQSLSGPNGNVNLIGDPLTTPGAVRAIFMQKSASEQIESVNQAKQDMDQAESELKAEPGNTAALQKLNKAKDLYDTLSKHLAEEDTRTFGSIEDMNKLLAQPEEYKTTYLKNLEDDVGGAKTDLGTASARYIAAIQEAKPTGNNNPESEKMEALLDASDSYRTKSDLYDRFLAKISNPLPSTTGHETVPTAADVHGTALAAAIVHEAKPAAAIDHETVPVASGLIQQVIDWFAKHLK